ncbi:ADYC domain-containing protein [Archangium lipolyticum]|uniref:ADYC domain-containing protein n=1 Tax=Archangium lipolyticum TaxID=2970465 RepID=UPI002149EABE|nr:ADYC domain-containing protein [Archangium lipolyticum]
MKSVMRKPVLAGLCLVLAGPAFAGEPSTPTQKKPSPGLTVAPLSEAERYARRCQGRAPDRAVWPQGTMLWGTRRAWGDRQEPDERRSVLVSVDLAPLMPVSPEVPSLRLVGGRLVAAPEASRSLVGTVLQGTSSDGKPVEVAVCGAEPSPGDPEVVWYRIEAWNPLARRWENPCVGTSQTPDPRALAVSGVWDAGGAHQAVEGKLTLACENGAITKCISWGYKPWASHDGHSLAELHQACTRMARADYCGNGLSHTRQDTPIDMYDRLGVLAPTTERSAAWDPERASFEATWAADGASCLARTRDRRALETILRECPGRFQAGQEVELGNGDRCTVQRAGVSPGAALLRNRVY